MIASITGSQYGANGYQADTFEWLLTKLGVTEFHHGDCVGVDVDFAAVARVAGALIIGHPPDNPYKRGNFPSDVVLAPKPFLARNDDLVSVARGGVLIGVPRTHEVPRDRHGRPRLRGQGTWSTILKGKRRSVPTAVIKPDGSIEWYHPLPLPLKLDWP